MIKSIKVTNYLGETIEISMTNPELSGFAIKEIDGLGPVKADINITDITTYDGGLFNSSRLNEREIKLTLIPIGGTNIATSSPTSIDDSGLLDDYVQYENLIPISNADIDSYFTNN